MRRNKILVLLVLVSLILTGCGGNATVGGITGASEGAVSAGAVRSEKGEEAQKGAEEGTSHNTYCTDTNLYRYISDNTGEYIIQSRLDGTHKKKLKIPDVEELDYVCGDWLYYEVLMKEKEKSKVPMTAVYRVPIRKDEEGYDVLEPEKAEEVVSGINTKAHIYVDDEYVLYTREDKGTFVKYKIRTQTECPNEDFDIEDAEPGLCIRVGDMFVMRDYDTTRMYAQRTEETAWHYIELSAVVNPACRLHVAWSEQAFYYVSQGEDAKDPEADGGEYVFQYDAARQTDELFVSGEELVRAAEQALALTGDEEVLFCFTDGLFYQSGRLYIQVQAEFMKSDGRVYMRYLLVSRDEKESGLRYEKTLTEQMWQHGDERVKETANANDAQCIAMWDGKAYFSLYDYKRKKAGLGCIELASGEFRQMEKDDAWFYTLYYDEQINYNHRGDIETVFEDDYVDNDCVGLTYSARNGIWFD